MADAVISQLRVALKALLLTVPGIEGSAGAPTETIPKSRYAWLGFDDETITSGQRELGIHELNIYYVVNRNQRLEQEVTDMERIIPALKTALRGAQSLGLPDLVDRVQIMRVKQGMILAGGGVEYTGFAMTIHVKTHENVGSELGG